MKGDSVSPKEPSDIEENFRGRIGSQDDEALYYFSIKVSTELVGGRMQHADSRPIPSERWRAMFGKIDRKKRNFVGPTELQHGFRKYLNMELSNEELMRVFDVGDSDQDGKIDYTDFAAIIEKGMWESARQGNPTRPAPRPSSAAPPVEQVFEKDGLREPTTDRRE